jgi:hypothetical protein
MRRAGRIIYNLAVVISLLLCLLTVGVWVRSYWVSDELSCYDWAKDRSFLDCKFIQCSRGGIRLAAGRALIGNVRSSGDAHFKYDRSVATKYPAYGDDFVRGYAGLGFEWIPKTTVKWFDVSGDDVALKSLTLPLYFPTLLFALLPAHYFLRVRRRRRRAFRLARGCCVFCGYDLRASAGRCPECGRDGALGK